MPYQDRDKIWDRQKKTARATGPRGQVTNMPGQSVLSRIRENLSRTVPLDQTGKVIGGDPLGHMQDLMRRTNTTMGKRGDSFGRAVGGAVRNIAVDMPNILWKAFQDVAGPIEQAGMGVLGEAYRGLAGKPEPGSKAAAPATPAAPAAPTKSPVAGRSPAKVPAQGAGQQGAGQQAQVPLMREPSQQAINLRNRAAMNLGAEIDPKAAGWLPHANLNPDELKKEIIRLGSADRKKVMIERNLAAIGEDRPIEAVAMDILREKGVISAGADPENMEPWQQEAMRARLAPAMEEARKRREVVMRRLSEDPNYYGGYEGPIGGGYLGETKGNWQDDRLMYDAIDGPVEEVDPNEFMAEVVTANVVGQKPVQTQRQNYMSTRQENVYDGDKSTFYMPGRSQRGFSSEREARAQMADAERESISAVELTDSQAAQARSMVGKNIADSMGVGSSTGKLSDNFKTMDEGQVLVDIMNRVALNPKNMEQNQEYLSVLAAKLGSEKKAKALMEDFLRNPSKYKTMRNQK